MLSEGRHLGALRRAVKTSAGDELFLLLAIGADAIGDLQVVRRGVTRAEVPPRIAIENIAQTSFADLLSELGMHSACVSSKMAMTWSSIRARGRGRLASHST